MCDFIFTCVFFPSRTARSALMALRWPWSSVYGSGKYNSYWAGAQKLWSEKQIIVTVAAAAPQCKSLLYGVVRHLRASYDADVTECPRHKSAYERVETMQRMSIKVPFTCFAAARLKARILPRLLTYRNADL